jgi:hypothetical protein
MTELAKSVKADGGKLVVFNPLPWVRSGLVNMELPAGVQTPAAVRDLASGDETPVSVTGGMISFAAKEVPAGGYRTFSLVEKATVVVSSTAAEALETTHFRVKFDTKRGGIASLVNRSDGRELASTGEHALGQYLHERFSKREVDAFLKSYCQVYYEWYGFPLYDFNKPRLDSTLSYARITPEGWTLKITKQAGGDRAVMTAKNTFGLAEGISLQFFFPNDRPYVDITWSVTGKTPEIIPEGGWLCLPLAINDPAFRVSHVSAPFSPEKDLVPGSNAHLFSIDYGISVRNGEAGPGVGVASSDLPLWSIGEPGLWKYSPKYLPRKAELFANLYNNQWNTNYPLWIDGTWSASIRLWPVSEKASEEEALFTPAWEYRQGFLTGYADGPGGKLPVTQTGLSLSRKGIRVTAFCPNPDADQGVEGTLVRVWEQAGQSGEVALTLPEGFKATKAQPVSLRGEKAGKAVSIKGGKLTFELGAYAPASFVIR